MSTEEVRAWIEKLGALGSSDEVAEFLAAEGVHGLMGDVYKCPVATLLHRKTHDVVHVTSQVIEVGAQVIEVGTYTRERFTTPWVVGQFIADFDSGAYRRLGFGNDPRWLVLGGLPPAPSSED